MTARSTLLAYRLGERASVAAAAAAALAAVVVPGCGAAQPPAAQGSASAAASAPAPVGECVELHGDGRREALSAAAAGCGGATSYTVTAHTDVTGICPPPGDGAVFVEPFADRLTSRLCLVPNLAVGHCYAFGTPSGRYNETDCASAGVAAISIEERFEVSDAEACKDPSRATVYRAVPRTYCVSYPGFDK